MITFEPETYIQQDVTKEVINQYNAKEKQMADIQRKLDVFVRELCAIKREISELKGKRD